MNEKNNVKIYGVYGEKSQKLFDTQSNLQILPLTNNK